MIMKINKEIQLIYLLKKLKIFRQFFYNIRKNIKK